LPIAHGEERLVIGLESGSSGDGVDAVLVGIRGSCETAKMELKHFVYMDFDEETRLGMLELFDFRTATLDKLTKMHAVLGELFADAALLVAEQHGTAIRDVECIGIWGQMVAHLPTLTTPFEWRGRQLGSALRVGDLNRVALRTGIPAMGDFPNGDIAAGGNGAPLVTPLFDYAMYHDPERNRVVQNIGGIANASLIPASGGLPSVISFDTGPGNMVIDGLVRRFTQGAEHFDRNGERAARGSVDEWLLGELMQEPFIQKVQPKAAGWENFGAHFVQGIVHRAESLGLAPDDVVATGTALTVEAIALGYQRHLLPACPGGKIDEVIVGGGGARNPTLMRMLGDRLGCPISTDEDYGVESFAREAMVEALTASELYLGHPNHAPSVSGASSPTFIGMVAPGYTSSRRGPSAERGDRSPPGPV
jgi:anhydro-N-acetylmuramic acid kinase